MSTAVLSPMPGMAVPIPSCPECRTHGGLAILFGILFVAAVIGLIIYYSKFTTANPLPPQPMQTQPLCVKRI